MWLGCLVPWPLRSPCAPEVQRHMAIPAGELHKRISEGAAWMVGEQEAHVRNELG